MTSNSTDLAGAFLYNVQAIAGFPLGVPPAENIIKYSDLQWFQTNPIFLVDYVTQVALDVDPDYVKTFNAAMDVRPIPQPISMTAEEWLQGTWFLAGQKWLPWFAPPSDPANPDKYLIRKSTNGVFYNPLSMPVLQPTLVTMAKIAGIGAVTYFGAKVGYKVIRKYTG